MTWLMRALSLLVKYGPTAWKIISEIDDLIEWMRDHEDGEVNVQAQNFDRAAQFEKARFVRVSDPEPLKVLRDDMRTVRHERESRR